MASNRKVIVAGILGFLSVLGSIAAVIVRQVCFIQSFWLHVMVFPVNPRTVSQSTAR